MWETILKLSTFAKSVASEADGSGSASRVVALLVTVACMAALLLTVYYQHNLPSEDQLIGLAYVLACGVGAYGVNQIKSKFSNSSNAPNKPDNPDA